jgi:AcrR family transcriptional regulator
MIEHSPAAPAAPADEEASHAQLMRFFTEQCRQPEMAAQIMEAAITLFARKGYAATSVREIVGAARVTSPMLYYYFQSKEGVFRALINALLSSFEGQIEQVLQRDCPLDEKLREVAQQHLRAAREVPVTLRFMFSTIFGPRDSAPAMSVKHRTDLLKKIASIFEDSITRGELTITSGITPTYLAQSFMGLLTHQMMLGLRIHDHDGEDVDEEMFLEQCMSEQNIDYIVSVQVVNEGMRV